jgi:hypothetical protein
MTKRLSQGRFQGWPRPPAMGGGGEALSALQAVQLRRLLAGALA